MKKVPTYSVEELRRMALTLDVEHEGFKLITDLINEELDLYDESEIEEVTQVSMILFSRALLSGAAKFLK